MPIDVVGLIIEKLDYRQQLKLRKVSKSLRALVDKHKPACKSIKVNCSRNWIRIRMNDQLVEYTDCKLCYSIDTVHSVIRDDFEKAAFDDLASTFKNPKLQLEELRICFSLYDKKDIETYYNNLRCVLKPLNHQVSVKKVELYASNASTLLSILPYLKPGFLEIISVSLLDENRDNWIIDPTGMDQVALLEQWKQAVELKLFDCFDRFPMEYAKHFKRLNFQEHDTDNFVRIKNYLSKLENFEHITMIVIDFFFCLPDFIYESLGTPVFSNTTNEVFHHPIPDSNYYFELKKAKDSKVVEIEKKKRETN